MRHIVSILMENEPGALSRVVGLFSQRGYNIESLTVAPTEDSSLSRLTLTTACDNDKIEQITKHLNKLVDVVKLVDLTEGSHIERELMLVKVKAAGAQRAEGGLLGVAVEERVVADGVRSAGVSTDGMGLALGRGTYVGRRADGSVPAGGVGVVRARKIAGIGHDEDVDRACGVGNLIDAGVPLARKRGDRGEVIV